MSITETWGCLAGFPAEGCSWALNGRRVRQGTRREQRHPRRPQSRETRVHLEVWEGMFFWGEGLRRKKGLRSGDLGSALRRKRPVLRAKNENGSQQTGPSGEKRLGHTSSDG